MEVEQKAINKEAHREHRITFLTNALCAMIRTLPKYGFWAYFVFQLGITIRAYAGLDSTANMNWVADISIAGLGWNNLLNILFIVIILLLGFLYCFERFGRHDDRTRIVPKLREYERRQDSGRGTSGLTKSGRTHPKDKD